MPTTIPNFGDVILLRFDFLDGTGYKNRPAVVVSNSAYCQNWQRVIFIPVSSSPGPVDGAMEITDLYSASLKGKSYCQGIISTADLKDIQRIIGYLAPTDIGNLKRLVRSILVL